MAGRGSAEAEVALDGIVGGAEKRFGFNKKKVSNYFLESEGVKKRHRRQVPGRERGKKIRLGRGVPHKKELV